MIDPNSLADNVLHDILENMGLEEDDSNLDELLNKLKFDSREEAFDKYLNWNGMIDYAESISKAYDSITIAWLYAECLLKVKSGSLIGVLELLNIHGTHQDAGLNHVFCFCKLNDSAGALKCLE